VKASVSLLSGGQRQGIAIARAVGENGRLLIMDEPTAALGVQETRKVLDLILKLKEQGMSILIISHNLRDVFEVCDRVVVLRGGKLAGTRATAESTPDEIVGLITGAIQDPDNNNGEYSKAGSTSV
jgi:ABC-type sugar transport system ATPase subunit